ncbi:hypothetical protein LO749_20890 [Paracoccus denitrificans]|uniref:hypothetical protein n=1 Tax=Paracoccus denitrificans TaxID=266 RepID=UPI001E4C73C9|nr:hypothetical protein [Paracoccus denitrificans]UFS66952.1 hypothetical protein LO749_20890 [Paracoccus denitrificans]
MRTLLIDGDVVAFQTAAAEEKAFEFEPGQWTYAADAEQGKANVDLAIDYYQSILDAERVVIAISDKENWRKEVLPTYKSNREGQRRPMILSALKDHLASTYETFIRPTLEADDILGILATSKTLIPGEKVILSIDKDLRTIPGIHWNPSKETRYPAGRDPVAEPVKVSMKEADLLFYSQALSGDAVDGYAGCPSIGPGRAKKIVRNPYELVREVSTISRGPNAGKERVRWVKQPTTDVWRAIVSHYERAGLTEEDALVTARVARILRVEDYDFKERKVKLWSPS